MSIYRRLLILRGLLCSNLKRNLLLVLDRMVKLIEEYSEIPTNKKVVLDFFADWCGPCRTIAPKFAELEGEFKTIEFLKVNVDDSAEIAERFAIKAMPTFVFIKNGKVIGSVEGADLKKIIVALETLEDS